MEDVSTLNVSVYLFICPGFTVHGAAGLFMLPHAAVLRSIFDIFVNKSYDL